MAERVYLGLVVCLTACDRCEARFVNVAVVRHPVTSGSFRSPKPRDGFAIPACNGAGDQIDVASWTQCNGTGPASGQMREKVGGVAPAGLFLEQVSSRAICAVKSCD